MLLTSDGSACAARGQEEDAWLLQFDFNMVHDLVADCRQLRAPEETGRVGWEGEEVKVRGMEVVEIGTGG